MQTDRVGAGGQLAMLLRHPAPWYIAGVLTFVLVVLRAFHPCFTAGIGTLDQPIQIISAQRVLHGERPYRDFQVLYGPLGSYVAAAAQWPLRRVQPVLAFHGYVYAALVLFYGIVCFRFSRVRASRLLFFAGSVLLLWQSSAVVASLAYYSLPMTLVVVVVILLLPFTVAGPRSRPGQVLLCQIVCGVLLAAEFLLRINFGVYLVTAVLITGVAAYGFGKQKAVAVSALRCLAFAAIAGCVLMGVFAAAGIAGPAITDMHAYLSRAVTGRALPWSMNPNHLLLELTVPAVACLLLGAVFRVRKGSIDFSLVPYLLLAAFFSYTIFRFDTLHLLPLVMISLLLIFDPARFAGEDVERGRAPGLSKFRRWVGLPELQVVALMLVFLQIVPASLHLGVVTRLMQRLAAPQPAATGEAVVVRHGVAVLASEARMLDRLNQMRRPGEEIYWASAPGACQSTFDMCVNLALYLADGELPRQKIWYFDTPSTPFDDVQQSIIDGLEAAKTPWVGMQDVYVRDPRGIAHPEAPLLRNFIESHYQLVFTSDNEGANRRYSIYTRKPNA